MSVCQSVCNKNFVFFFYRQKLKIPKILMILNKYNMLYAIVSNLKNLIKSFPLYKNSRYKIRFECEIYVFTELFDALIDVGLY